MTLKYPKRILKYHKDFNTTPLLDAKNTEESHNQNNHQTNLIPVNTHANTLQTKR